MGIYIFNTDTLLEYLNKLENIDLDFGQHIIPTMIKEEKKRSLFIATTVIGWM